MEPWHVALLLFVLLAPLVLMVVTWGDERLTFRGRPVERDWRAQVHPELEDDHH